MVPVSVDGQVLCLRGCDGDDYTSALHSLEQFLKKYLKKDMFFFLYPSFSSVSLHGHQHPAGQCPISSLPSVASAAALPVATDDHIVICVASFRNCSQ